MDVVNVHDVLDKLFPGYNSPGRAAEWEVAKSRFPIGLKVSGNVVAQFHFGVFVDIDAGFPALILVTELRHTDKRPYTSVDALPAIGSTVEARVRIWADRQIGLTSC